MLSGVLDSYLIAEIVQGVRAVASHPVPFYVVGFNRFKQLFPQVSIKRRASVGPFPASSLPVLRPALFHSVYQVLGVGKQSHVAVAAEPSKRFQCGHELHPIVGGPSETAGNELLLRAVQDESGKATLARVSEASSIRVHGHDIGGVLFHVHSVRLVLREYLPAASKLKPEHLGQLDRKVIMVIRFTRRQILQAAGLSAFAALCKKGGGMESRDWEDLARASARDEWLHHPVIGDPSWDAWERDPANPIYVGSEPHHWPVNGTLFRDPLTGYWYAVISVYPRGYFGGVPFDIRILREAGRGQWEDLGLVFGGNFPEYPGVKADGGATDGQVVYYEKRYHMIFGWANRQNTRGGLGYAWSDRPEGPYRPSPVPLDDDAGRSPILGRYVRAYAGSLIRRRHDWLILHMMSTPGNAGGTWGLFGRSAPRPEGPYSDPVPLLLPQSDVFHPPLAEFFPAYVMGQRVYAPFTSVAANRNFQVLYSAPIERALQPGAWRVERLGSLWHREPVPWEATGLWGQTMAVTPDGRGNLRALFPSKTAEDIGAIGLAHVPVARQLRDGFVFSAPNAEAHAVLRRAYEEFSLRMAVEAQGNWSLSWACSGPLGPDHHLADSRPHPFMNRSRTDWRFDNDQWRLVDVNEQGEETTLASGQRKNNGSEAVATLALECSNGRLILLDNNQELVRLPYPLRAGRLEIVAGRGAHLCVRRLEIRGKRRAYSELWLPTEGLAGAAARVGEWVPEPQHTSVWGPVLVSTYKGARAKFNFVGTRCVLLAPTDPSFGVGLVRLDGKDERRVNFAAPSSGKLEAVHEANVRPGRHALVLEAVEGVVPCGFLRVWQ